MNRVKVMKPIFRPEIESSFVLYPYRIYHLRLYYKRLRMRDKVFDYFAYVDLYRLGAERGDRFIELQEWEVEEKAVMNPLVNEEEARMKAFESAITWGNSRVISWWLPRIEVVREELAYKVFWLYEKDGERLILDSLDGKEYSLDVLTGKGRRTCKGPFCR
ncbi:hypothetical protein [Thermococcus nautili]|uniref:Uncharacterized protein n=1 Tax=Thermococcus nautili TaxID=195522 RepID=W8PM46_9EURY|nr:hypothetical protein [Thermococcus nautili]AHL23139.1 hypothetical protein BD01_1531 [Thermococcus nautili]